MTDQDRESAGMTPNPVPVTPSEHTERLEGLAFDVEDSADLPGVPTGDQHPRNTSTVPAHESGAGVGLQVPGDEGPGGELGAYLVRRVRQPAALPSTPSRSSSGSSRSLRGERASSRPLNFIRPAFSPIQPAQTL